MSRIAMPERPAWWIRLLFFVARKRYGKVMRPLQVAAAEATRAPAEVSDETFAALRRQFTNRQIVELTFAVAIENFFNRVNAPLGIEAEGFCAVAPLERAA